MKSMALTSFRLDIHPFMSYAAAYALYNYHFADHAIGASEYDNLRLIRAFERGLDPSSSEAGFVLTHVDMVKHSSGLIKGTADILNAISSGTNRSDVIDGFETMLETMRHIEASMETMWNNSKPKEYNTYRTFLFGNYEPVNVSKRSSIRRSERGPADVHTRRIWRQ